MKNIEEDEINVVIKQLECVAHQTTLSKIVGPISIVQLYTPPNPEDTEVYEKRPPPKMEGVCN